MCSLLRLCQTVLVCLATAWPSMPVHSELSVPPLQAQAMESHAATASSANRHMTTVWCGQSGFSRSLTARLPPCPYCALACVAPLLSCASRLCAQGRSSAYMLLPLSARCGPLPVPGSQGSTATSSPRSPTLLATKVRGLPSHLAPRPPPPPPSPPRLPGPNANPNPNQARAVGLPPDALEAAAAQLERREAVVAEAERGGAPRGPALPLPLGQP